MLIRAFVDHAAEAIEWLARIERRDVRAACPELLFLEVASALLTHQRAGRMSRTHAAQVLDATARVPFVTHSVRRLSVPAWGIAVERGLSAYDACYVVLAETMGATLLTADKRLAAATADSVLITG